jgi:tetratricopeptide (TPR) repeat protein
VILSFFRGRAQWGLVKQGSADFAPEDARRSWVAALENEPDWMEIEMAAGFAHYAVGREDLALEAWQKAIDLASKQPNAQNIYFSEQSASDYALNAQAGVAMAALALAKIQADPAQRNQLLAEASEAYRQVMDQAPSDFNAQALGGNWLWLGGAIADWESTKQELSQTLE